MPTDPPQTNSTAQPVPLGQAQPTNTQQHLPPHRQQPQIQYQPPQQPRHRQTPHTHLHPHPHYPRHPPQPQYAPLSQQPRSMAPQQPPQTHVPSPMTQRRDAVPPQQPHFFPMNSYPINSFPGRVPIDQYGVNNYMFQQPPYQYNTIPNPAAPQQPTPVGSRGARSFNQPLQPELHSKQASRVTLPPTRKKVIPIYDPDTKEEIKVSGNENTTPSTNTSTTQNVVKIPPRTSRPLELVADPADVSKSTDPNDAAIKSSTESLNKTSIQSNIKTSDTMPTSAPIPTDVNQKTSSVSESSGKKSANDSISLSKPRSNIESIPTTEIATRNANMKSDELLRPMEVITSDASSSTVPDLPTETDDTTTETDVNASRVAMETNDANFSRTTSVDSTTTGKKFNLLPLSRDEKESSQDNVTKSNKDNANGEHKQTFVGDSQVTRSSAQSSEYESGDISNDQKMPSIPRRERPVFKEGDRKVYDRDLIHELRLLFSTPRAVEIENALHSAQLHKSDPDEQGKDRGGRTMRQMPSDARRPFSGQGGPGFQLPARMASGVVGGGMGTSDAFDLRSARSQNPPPTSRHNSSNRDVDLRGSRNGSRGRFDVPNRGGHGPIDSFVNPTMEKIEKLPKSENAWKRNKDNDDDVTSKVKQVRSLLNKLTLEKFEKIFKQIIDIDLSSYEIVIGVVKEIFEKTLFEPKFSEMYAELCQRLERTLTPALMQAGITDSQGKSINFKRILLNNCRDEFNTFKSSNQEDGESSGDQGNQESAEQEKDDEKSEKPKEEGEKEKDKGTQHERQLEAFRAKRRMLANVRFIGELFLKDLIPERTIHRFCIHPLLTRGVTSKEEDILEALCKLLSKTGAKLSTNQDAITHIDNYFKRLIALQKDSTLPARVRFMIQDLVEQREDNWKLRREEAKAKTIAEIHKDIEKEERAKIEAQAAARERRNRGGNMHSRERGPHSSTPRVAMTMASRQRPTSSVSRSTAMLEKHASRGSAGISSNLQSKRLGPSGSKLGSGGAGGVGASLRPASRLNQFAALADTRDTTGNSQSSDVRRNKLPIWQTSGRRSATKHEISEPKIKTLEPEKVKIKARGIIEEYWSIQMMSEVKECVEKEVPTANHAAFVEECLKFAIDANKEKREKSGPFFVGLCDSNISTGDFFGAFKSIIADLQDMTVDNPMSAEFVANYLGAVVGAGKFNIGNRNDFDITFLRPLVSEMYNKKLSTKLLLSVFSETLKNLSDKIPDVNERKAIISRGWDLIDVDVAADMNIYNRMRGLDALKDMVKERKLEFLFPLIDPEMEFKKCIEANNSEETNIFFKKHKSLVTGTMGEKMMRMLVRVTLDWLFGQPLETFKEKFKSVLCVPLIVCFNEGLPKELQLAAIIGAQAFIILNSETLPPLGSGSDAHSAGSLVFEALYDGDLAEEDAFMQWKEDTNKSMTIAGKPEMIIQTSKFFSWLESAEVGE